MTLKSLLPGYAWPLKECLLLTSVGGHFSHVPFLRQEMESVLSILELSGIPWRECQGPAGHSARLTSYLFPNSPFSPASWGLLTHDLFQAGSKELAWEASQAMPPQRGPGPGNQAYSAPVGGAGLPPRKSLKSSRRCVVSVQLTPVPRTALGGNRGQCVPPLPMCKASEGAWSALPEAPVQGQPGHRSTLQVRTHCSRRARSSAAAPTALDTLPARLLGPNPGSSLTVSPRSVFLPPLLGQHSASSTLLSQALLGGVGDTGIDLPDADPVLREITASERFT